MSKKFDFKSVSSSQACVVGNLQRLLSQGEYHPFTSVPLFESKFVEINERGESISLHNRPSYVTIGICAVSPSSRIPNVMLIAREEPVSLQEIMANFWKFSEQLSHVEHLVLTRLFPLTVVELSVHSTDKYHLMLRLVNGHSHYLELCAPPDQQQHLFHQWLQLISLLKKRENTGNTEVNVKSKDFVMCHKGAPSTNNSSENRDSPRGVTNTKTEEKVVTEQSSSKQVALSGTVGTTEEGGRKGEAFHSSLKPTRQETTLQSNNIDPLDTKKSRTTENRKTREGGRKGEMFHSSLKPTRQETTLQSNNIDPLDTKKSRTTENRKTRTKTRKQSGKKLLTSGNQESGSKSLLQLISQVISK